MSYLIVAIVLFLLILNVIFRIKIIKKYKALSNKNINIDPKLMFDKAQLESYVRKYYPEHEADILDLRRWMNNLLYMGIAGLLLIISVYLILKFL